MNSMCFAEEKKRKENINSMCSAEEKKRKHQVRVWCSRAPTCLVYWIMSQLGWWSVTTFTRKEEVLHHNITSSCISARATFGAIQSDRCGRSTTYSFATRPSDKPSPIITLCSIFSFTLWSRKFTKTFGQSINPSPIINPLSHQPKTGDHSPDSIHVPLPYKIWIRAFFIASAWGCQWSVDQLVY